MKRWFIEFLSNKERAYRLTVNWIFALGLTSGIIAITSIFMMTMK